MAAPKRTPFQIEHDRTRIAHLYLTRVPQGEIADELGLTQQMVSYDLAAIKREWKRERLKALDEATHRELARVDALEIEYWDAWRESKHDKVAVTTETAGAKAEPPKDGEGPAPAAPPVKTQERREGQTGNPAYLAGVQWCIGKRVEILGLAAPVKIAPTDPTGEKPYESLTDSERIARAAALFDAARARRDGSPPGDGATGQVPEVPGEISG